jgi:HEAT repeat protein
MSTQIKLILGLVFILLVCGLIWSLNRNKQSLSKPTPDIDREAAVLSEPARLSKAAPTPTPSTQPTVVSTEPTGAHPKKFRKMTILERADIIKEIEKNELDEIFQLFLNAGRVENDLMKRSGIRGAFIRALKSQQPSPAFLEKMRQFVSDEGNSDRERGLIMSAFGAAGTKEAAEFLQWAATSSDVDELVRVGGRSGIAKMGREGPRDYTFKIAEPLWRDGTDDYTLNASAEAIANSGDPKGIKLLLSAALAPDEQDDGRKKAAIRALKRVYSNNAVPPLVEVLEQNPVGTPANALAFNTLAQITRDEAPKAMIKWLQTADSLASEMAKEWITHANTPSQLKAAKAALDPKVPFRSEANREALRAGLEVHAANRTFEK